MTHQSWVALQGMSHSFIELHKAVVLVGFPGGSEVKASAFSEGDWGLIPRLGKSPGEGNGNPLQYSCLENPVDGGAWWTTVQGVAKSLLPCDQFV